MPEGLFGAQKMAAAEWKTEIPMMLSVVGQRVRGSDPMNIGCCSQWVQGPLETSENILGTLQTVDQCTYNVSAKNISSTFEM